MPCLLEQYIVDLIDMDKSFPQSDPDLYSCISKSDVLIYMYMYLSVGLYMFAWVLCVCVCVYL